MDGNVNKASRAARCSGVALIFGIGLVGDASVAAEMGVLSSLSSIRAKADANADVAVDAEEDEAEAEADARAFVIWMRSKGRESGTRVSD